MNADLLPDPEAWVSVVAIWLLLLGLGARWRQVSASRGGRLALAAAAIAFLFLPVGGLPVWSWCFGVYPNPCLPMLVLLLARRLPRFFGKVFLQPADWNAVWLFGAVAGAVIYLCPALFGGIDIYFWGWDRTLAAGVLAGGATLFLAFGNRFGIILLAALLAYAVGLLESANCWDYVVDPVYWLASMGVVLRRAIAWALTARAESVPAAALPEAMAAPVAAVSISRA